MSESLHTPGPWVVHPNSSVEHGWFVEHGADARGYYGKAVVPAIKKEADARLISSAPDLLIERDKLKALNAELAEALESMVANFDYDGEIAREVRAIERARAALEKFKEKTA